MSKFSQKVQIFIFGASIGILIGSLFFIFKLDGLFSKVSLFESGTKAKVVEEVVNQSSKENLSDTVTAIHSKTTQSQKRSYTSISDSTTNFSNYSMENNQEFIEDENINVLKEELMSVKNITLKNYDDSKIERTDSMLREMSGINTNKSDIYLIEFWKTPLNSKGYKMTRNRVLVYGLKDNDDLKIAKINENYYLKNNTEVFKLSYSSEFKPMERVNEENILRKLN